MQDGSQRTSNDQPQQLTYSTAAREATPEDATPRRVVRRRSSVASVRSSSATNNTVPVVATDSDVGQVNAAKDFRKHHEPSSGTQSCNVGPSLASAVTPETELGQPDFALALHLQNQLRNIPSTAWASFPVIIANETLFASWTHLRDSRAPCVFKIRSDDDVHRFSLASTTEFRAGLSEKCFNIHTDLLVQKSPYFASMRSTQENPQPADLLRGPLYFREFDEFAFALFLYWMYGGNLHGPHDFHSMNHYLCLYVFAHRFQIETLKNSVMDLVRAYYHRESMTAPAFRLDYLYSHTSEPCLMRRFLVMTAAYRALSDSEHEGGISNSVRGVLRRGGDLAVDFADALCTLVKNGRQDVRKGEPCLWHDHDMGASCGPVES